jgi:hypothetical protein
MCLEPKWGYQLKVVLASLPELCFYFNLYKVTQARNILD